MSPLDNELRHTLSEHATDVDDSPDLWVRVEHRAQVMHRRRLAAGGVVGTAVLAAIVVVGVNITSGNQADRLVPATPTPSSSMQPSPAATPVPTMPGGHVPVTAWPTVGSDPGWVQWNAVVRSLPAQMPEGFAPLGGPVVIGSGDTDGGPVAVFVIPAGHHLVAGAVLRSARDVAVGVHDIPTDGDVPYVGVVVQVSAPGGTVDDGVVVGAPTTGQIEFKLPDEPDFHSVDSGSDPRWATVTLGRVQPGQPVAQVRVLDGDGNLESPSAVGPIQAALTFPDV